MIEIIANNYQMITPCLAAGRAQPEWPRNLKLDLWNTASSLRPGSSTANLNSPLLCSDRRASDPPEDPQAPCPEAARGVGRHEGSALRHTELLSCRLRLPGADWVCFGTYHSNRTACQLIARMDAAALVRVQADTRDQRFASIFFLS